MCPANDIAHDKEQVPLQPRREPFVALAFATLAAPLCWVLHFALVYLLEGFLCTRIPAAAVIPGAIVAATAVFGGACAWSLFAGATWLRKAGAAPLQSRDFLRAAQRLLAGLALVAIVWGGTGVLFLSPCG